MKSPEGERQAAKAAISFETIECNRWLAARLSPRSPRLQRDRGPGFQIASVGTEANFAYPLSAHTAKACVPVRVPHALHGTRYSARVSDPAANLGWMHLTTSRSSQQTHAVEGVAHDGSSVGRDSPLDSFKDTSRDPTPVFLPSEH